MGTSAGASNPDETTPVEGVGPKPTIYDVARLAGVATSTVSRALSNPGRVRFETAERIRKVAEEIGYRSGTHQRDVPKQQTMMLAMIVADINNPVFHGMVRGAERAAAHSGHKLLVVETQESEAAERSAIERVLPAIDGLILASSRMSDSLIREFAKQRPLVVLNRVVAQVASVTSDNIKAIKDAVEHLAGSGVNSISYLAGPEASWADAMRWRGLVEAGRKLDLRVHRIGPCDPTMVGGIRAAERWWKNPTPGVIAYNDLIAIGFIRAVIKTHHRVPEEVQVIGFDNIVDAALIEPRLTSIASPVVSLGSAAVIRLLRSTARPTDRAEIDMLPARLIIRDTTGLGRG